MKLRNGLIACLICFGAVLAPATARASDGFFGVVPQSGVSSADLAQMKAGGLESIRITVPWSSVEPTRGSYTFSALDELVGNASRAGLTVLPTIYSSPSWVASDSRSMPNNSSELNDWSAMLTAFVKRYGPQGSFWSAQPSIPRVPIGTWQIWNEENTVWFAKPVKPTEYANLVIQSAATLRAQDPAARIVLGGMYSTPTSSQGILAPSYLDSLYKVPGFGSSFDAAAVHPYATTIDRSMDGIEKLRAELNQSGDSAKGIYVDEIGWGSDSLSGLGQGSQDEQAKQLTSAYKALLASRESLGTSAVYWFAWKDAVAGEKTCNFCFGTGLLDSKGSPKLAWNALTAVIAGQGSAALAPTTPAADSPAANAPVLARCIVPRVRAKRLRVARRLLRKAHCRVRVVQRAKHSFRFRKWTVTSQSKRPRSVWPAGKKIRVVVARHKHRHGGRHKHSHRH